MRRALAEHDVRLDVGRLVVLEQDHGWRDVDGIRFEAVELHGSYPDTRLALLFRSVPSPTGYGTADPNCVFGSRWPIWPAIDPDPAEQARQLLTTFDEFLGTNRRAERIRGVGDCDPDDTNWLD